MNRLTVGMVMVALSGMGSARAEEPRQIIPHIAPEGTPWADGIASAAARINKQSKGRLKLRAVPGGGAGDEVELVHQCAQGKVMMWGGSMGALATEIPEANVFELPFLFDSDADVEAAFDGAVQAKLGKILERKGMALYGMTELGWRNFGARRPLRRPADFQGLRVRSQENPIHLEMWRLLGATPKSISVLETLTALQGGAVEGFDQSPVYLFASSWHQAITTYSLSRHIFQVAVVVSCKDALARFSGEERKQLFAGSGELMRANSLAVRKLMGEVLKEVEQAHITVVELSAEDRAALAERTRPAHQTFRQGTTPAGRELLTTIDAALKRRRHGSKR